MLIIVMLCLPKGTWAQKKCVSKNNQRILYNQTILPRNVEGKRTGLRHITGMEPRMILMCLTCHIRFPPQNLGKVSVSRRNGQIYGDFNFLRPPTFRKKRGKVSRNAGEAGEGWRAAMWRPASGCRSTHG